MVSKSRKTASRRALSLLLVGAAPFCSSLPAQAENPLGLYIGAGVGESHVRNDNVASFVENHTGWKALIGIRPIAILGAELEYTDFGHPGATGVTVAPGLAYNVDASQKATSLFGVAYLPLPLPVLDIYGKAGWSNLKSEINASCVTPTTCGGNPPYHQESTDSRLAYGLGAQAKFLALGVRAEYERISAPGGSPDLYSLIATWTF
jgi:Outer membrane protein beta-barrel domain